jgi:pimeloyl-ACP methyl ester carboxylesterase
MSDRFTRTSVAVAGGTLSVGQWQGDGDPVIAIHGISSTQQLWLWTAVAAPDVHLVAPDLRGRGDSFATPGPFGLDCHRDDVLAVMDALGIERATVLGMSMGGFVATAVAQAAPERVRQLLLVDGGPPMALPPRATDDEPLSDRLERTVQTFASPEEYKKLFCAGVGTLLDPEDELLSEYLAYDLVGEAPALEVRLNADAVRQDAADAFNVPVVEARMAGLSVPTTLLYAEWSIGAGTPPAYPADVVAGWCERLPLLETRLVAGLDHAGMVMTARGGAEVARELRRLGSAGS